MLLMLCTLSISETTHVPSLAPSPRLPRPLVIVIGMPKCGTGTINEFFKCNGWKTSHYACRFDPNKHIRSVPAAMSCGNCVTRWVLTVMDQPVGDKSAQLRLACGNYDVFAEMDYAQIHTCMFPQVFFLQTLLTYLPHACFVLNTRPTDHWLSSVRNFRWGYAHLMPRILNNCPINPRNETGLGDWYERHNLIASLALRSARCALEFDIEDGVGLTTHLDRFFTLNSSTKCLQAYSHKTMSPPPSSPSASPPPPSLSAVAASPPLE